MVSLHLLFIGFCTSALALGLNSFHKPHLSATYSAVLQEAQQDSVKTATAALSPTAKSSKKQRRQKKERVPAAAGITMKRNVTRATITQRTTDGYNIEVILKDAGLPVQGLEDLQLAGSSGGLVTTGSYLGFDNVVYPFEGTIRFKSPNKLRSVVYERLVTFKVEQPGNWVVRVDL